MDESSYAAALDAITFDEYTTCIHYYDSSQEENENPKFTWESVDCLKRQLPEVFPPTQHQVSEKEAAVNRGKPILRLLVGFGKGSTNRPLSVGKDSFKQIMSGCGFPKVFAETIRSHNGSFACFLDHDKVNDKVSPNFLSIVIKTPNSGIVNFSFVMRINVVDCSATGLYFQGDGLKKVNSLPKRLQGHRRLLRTNPLAFLGILMEEYGRTCERDRARNDRDVVTIEGRTGMTSLPIATFYSQVAKDYELLIEALHSCNTNLIFLDNMTNFEVAVVRFIKETLIRFQMIRERRLLEKIPADVDDTLIQNIEYLLNAAEMRRYQAQSLHRRTQTQINVLYSMISQRDSKVNISVAEDSKRIAAAAKRDSLAMKTVSMLTLVFLPGTFVAAIFSAGIFHFERAATNLVSDLWWVYFVVSGLLTIVTVGIWIVYMRWRNSGIRREEEKLEKIL